MDRGGWTYTYYNRNPTLSISANANEGVESKGGIYHFTTTRKVLQSLDAMGITVKDADGTFQLNEAYLERPASIKEISGDKLFVQFEGVKHDPEINGWYRNKAKWERIFNCPRQQRDIAPVDHLVRHLVAGNKEAGWFVRNRNTWTSESKGNIVDVLVSQGINRGTVQEILGKSVVQCWRLVNEPFKDEYPGDRKWNKNAAKLAVKPSNGRHETWTKVLEHCGSSFNKSIQAKPNSAFESVGSQWARDHNIETGGEYLLIWVASLFQSPLEPLPYLFLHGPQDSGKSTLHEALALLMNGGYVRADVALTSTGSFNGELEGAVLCSVEEVDLRNSKVAYEKIKDWTTSRSITIHVKGHTPYDINNSTHWIQCANNPGFCPVLSGDTRIIVGYVPVPKTIIPKTKLFACLMDEAPAFLKTVLEYEIPEPIDRMRIPVISTEEKQIQEEINESILISFIKANFYTAKGESIEYQDFVERFHQCLTPREANYWSMRRISQNLPHEIIKGKMGEYNTLSLGNVSWRKPRPGGGQDELVKSGDRLRRKKWDE
jgi:hypothetical protein